MNDLNVFINNWNEFRHAKIGLEFEFYSNYNYIKTMELLNIEMSPIEIFGFNEYHSTFAVSNNKFKIEPDFSGGSEMVELITGILEYNEAKIIITKVLKFIKKHGYTTDDCSIHINISFDDINVKDMKTIKLILNLNEEYIYEYFPTRRNNIYARSIKNTIPFEKYIDVEFGLNHVLKSFRIPDNPKYYGINFEKQLKNYLEYRYIGGENYEDKKDIIYKMMDYFILQTRNAIINDYDQNDLILLSKYLNDNISWYKKYDTYEKFLKNLYYIVVEVDRNDDMDIINEYWNKFNDILFSIVKNTSMSNFTINYNSYDDRVEIIKANIDDATIISNVDLVNCRINNANIYKCDIVNCEINNSHIYESKIYDSKIYDSKLTESKAMDYTEIINSTFISGVLDCIMSGGVFRSGKITQKANIDNTVKMANYSDFWMISRVDSKKKIKK